MKTYQKNRIQCKCGKWFMSRKALGHHIRHQKIRIDISHLHSAQGKAKNVETVQEAEASAAAA